jgi:hypothetical protein
LQLYCDLLIDLCLVNLYFVVCLVVVVLLAKL